MSASPNWYDEAFGDAPTGLWWLTGDIAAGDLGYLVQALTMGMCEMARRAGIDDAAIPQTLAAPVLAAFKAARESAEDNAAEVLCEVVEAFAIALESR